MNTVHISGNIGAEPEFKVFDSGKRKVIFSVALNQYRTNGEHCDTIWIPCLAWDSIYDRLFKCQQQLKLSGRRIYITGSFSQSRWIDQTTGKQHTRLTVKVQSFEIVAGPQQDSAAAQLLVEGSDAESKTAAEIVFDGKPVQLGNHRRMPLYFKSSELRSAKEDSSP
jgi:single stranded DNA-binding protein